MCFSMFWTQFYCTGKNCSSSSSRPHEMPIDFRPVLTTNRGKIPQKSILECDTLLFQAKTQHFVHTSAVLSSGGSGGMLSGLSTQLKSLVPCCWLQERVRLDVLICYVKGLSGAGPSYKGGALLCAAGSVSLPSSTVTSIPASL